MSRVPRSASTSSPSSENSYSTRWGGGVAQVEHDGDADAEEDGDVQGEEEGGDEGGDEDGRRPSGVAAREMRM